MLKLKDVQNSIKSLEIDFFSYLKNDIIYLISMKKLVIAFVSIMLIIFAMISYMVYVDNRDNNKLNKLIVEKTKIKDFNYVSKYDNYYIVLTDDYLYLYDNKFLELFKIDASLIHQNDKNYDIIYSNKKLMYFNDCYKGKKNIIEYYDLYTYELIERIVLR